ncbi:AMP-binding protein [Xanthomonas sp. XNM01]|uniref:AMP-binding protein n=1 Tax=Xanthomonas sp. XNM01 TaxID=2769289 RepID=UPI0017865E1E|nr:AMP-binding protein [Xanthomonas sp. XNM01]MBD9370614.1 acyl-CoA synthetase [Xanthomonas sp. XNM01]
MSADPQFQPDAIASARPAAIGAGTRAFCFEAGATRTLEEFLGHVRGVAAGLPGARHVVNLCEDRYRFLVAFCAAALRGQTTLLPPSRAPEVVLATMATHGDAYCLGDDPGLLPEALAETQRRLLPPVLPSEEGAAPLLATDWPVAIGYTSGSTGQPQAHVKTWASFITSTAQNLAALQDLWGQAQPQVVATVPPQHMYGMELSVLLPLLGGAAVHAGRPLFPADVAQALADAPAPRLLVTTPVHLRALLQSDVDLPPLAGIVSATAPLAPELAAAAEARYGCEVREVFGSTETCVFARRRTAADALWTPLPGVRVVARPDGALVHAAHLPQPVALADLVEVEADGRFRLCGRQADLLEIAGKRASLGDLTRRLLAVPGVEDGVVVQLPADGSGGIGRIAALAVAPGLSPQAIVEALRAGVDPVFLPRRVRLLDALPRNATGKLLRHELLALLDEAADRHSSAGGDAPAASP